MSYPRVSIAGATGYAGEELIRILRQHPSIQLSTLTASAKWDRPVPLADVFPRFSGELDLRITALDPSRLAASSDVVFLALPHGMSMDLVPELLAHDVKVIDLAGDFRLRDPAAFARAYQTTHTHPELLSEAIYGITELAGTRLRNARLVANPGCYATSVILACAPLFEAGVVDPEHVIVDAKSGLTGAGRKAQDPMMFAEMNENLWAYKVNSHQHVPEIEQALAPWAGQASPSVCLVPHVVPMNRGIVSTLYLRLTKPSSWEDLQGLYRRRYASCPFIRIRPKDQWPKIHEVAGTNYCDLAVAVDQRKELVIVCAAIDNLLKGASGQAVQNLNAMFGWPETAGLR